MKLREFSEKYAHLCQLVAKLGWTSEVEFEVAEVNGRPLAITATHVHERSLVVLSVLFVEQDESAQEALWIEGSGGPF